MPMIEENAWKQNKAIGKLLRETARKAERLGCSLSVNGKTGKYSWRKYKEVDMSKIDEGDKECQTTLEQE